MSGLRRIQAILAYGKPLLELCAASTQGSQAAGGLRLLACSSTSCSTAGPNEPSTSYSQPPLSLGWAVSGHRSHQQTRSYAKAAAGGSGGKAGAGDAEPKTRRRRFSKLWCVRNQLVRHGYEQIWPTLKLTEEQAAEFRRNSRQFVVDMGKTITLKNKFKMNLKEKPGIYQVPSLLYESNLHLDAVGEHPRYLKIRRVKSAYATQLQNLRKLRVLLGGQRRYVVQKMYEQALLASGSNRQWKLISAMESKLAMFSLRMGLAEDIVGAKRAVEQNRVVVNGAPMPMKFAGYMQPGDVVSPGPGSRRFFQERIARSLKGVLHEVNEVAHLQ